ncbi:hypothetical protein M2Y09_29090, partial [Klebsiella pneumoniae]|nr:hypothetical protein [Klebsiella pneumoniae]
QNDVTLKMPAFEWVHVQLHQQKGMISLSPPTICNSAARSGCSFMTDKLTYLAGLFVCFHFVIYSPAQSIQFFQPSLVIKEDPIITGVFFFNFLF